MSQETEQAKRPDRGRWKLREWESHVDRAIREAQERGDFDRLEGLGKPLANEPWEGDWALAHHVLRQSGETLPWIALSNEVEQLVGQLSRDLASAADARRRRGHSAGWADERARLRTRYLERAADLDRKLVELSFVIPSRRLERGRLPPHIAENRFESACPA